MQAFLVIVGVVLAIWGLIWIIEIHGRADKYTKLKPRLDKLDEHARELDSRDKALQKQQHAIMLLAQQKAIGFPWLAEAYSEFFELEELQRAAALVQKKHPALKAAEQVREAAKLRRIAQKEARILRYQINFYETLFPWLSDLRSEDIDDELIRVRQGETADDDDDDAAKRWLTPEEYARLPSAQKYQLALDRYWTKKKSKWEIGRDYERYIGYLYENKGFSVSYQGIIQGFDDLGRDLICEKGTEIIVVQCKCWSREKTIHEKHIFQLYGSLIAYRVDHPSVNAVAHFVTSTSLSDRARVFAKVLQIEVAEGQPLVQYPSIKCNVNRRDKTKIYHLPFDQQYDRTLIKYDLGEKYVASVKEAEKLGFRRAFRYRGLPDGASKN
ncbi:MAG: restriction endonuclease [Pseudomonadota bacterium]